MGRLEIWRGSNVKWPQGLGKNGLLRDEARVPSIDEISGQVGMEAVSMPEWLPSKAAPQDCRRRMTSGYLVYWVWGFARGECWSKREAREGKSVVRSVWLRQSFFHSGEIWNSLGYSPGWPQTHSDSPGLAFQVLGLQVCMYCYLQLSFLPTCFYAHISQSVSYRFFPDRHTLAQKCLPPTFKNNTVL